MNLSGWLAVLVVVPSLLLELTNGDFPSGANQAVRCMLAHNTPDDCDLPEVKVPSYLLREYNDGPSSLHEALHQKTLAQLSEDQVSDIPLSLIYLIPRGRLEDFNVSQLRAILHKHADDTSLVHQLTACLQHGNKMPKLIEKMNVSSLPEESLQIFAESIEITDFTSNFINFPFIEKEPLLAYLRPAVLFNVDTSTLFQIFNVLQLTESKLTKTSVFYFLTEAAIRHRVPLSKLRGFVLGLSSDQLLNESLSFDNTVSEFQLDLSIMQAQALFERTYQNMSLSSSDFIDSKPLLYKLSPELLQRFPQNVQKYDVNYIEPTASIPLPTACQITEYVKADCIRSRRLPKNEDEFWDINIRHLGKWVYTLPLSALEGYKASALSTAVLKTLESPAISPMQAYYLSGKGEALDVMAPNSVLELETFLHALPASQLVNRKLGEISFHVKLHLVSKLPANNLARTLSLVNKITSSLGDPVDVATDDSASDSSILEELLGNRDINHIMALLSPKDLALSAKAILKSFAETKIRNLFGQTIQHLPQQILGALLDYDRLNNPDQWRWSRFLESSQVSHLLVGGLTCQDIEEMDTGLFIPIMSRYNSVRKKPFPKNLQHCCLQKLINHLKLKMTLTQTDPGLGLISLLEPIEIESIGGYILVNLPIDAMKASPYLGHILSKIGQLSSAELMLSTDISKLKLIAELAVDKERNVNTFLVRNLVWFLPPNATSSDLKLMLEAQRLDTTVCLPTEARRHTATRLISVFGSPEHWSAGVLATLQDLLIVFSDEELSKIPQSSWTNAAASFISHYDDAVDWIEQSAFYKVCANLLGISEENDYKNDIGRYIRWRLKAAQWLLDTVVPIPQPEVPKPNPTYTSNNLMNQAEEPKTTLGIFDHEGEGITEEADESEYEDSEENEEITKEETTMSTEKSTTEKFTTEEPIIEKSTTKESFNEEVTDESTAKRGSSTDKSLTYHNVPEDYVTQSSTQEKNTSTVIMFVETGGIISTEESITGKIEESKVSILYSTTQKPTTLNITATSITNKYISRGKNVTVPTSENTTDIENIAPCINSVDNEDCQNDTSISPNKANEMSVNEITHGINDTASQIYPNPTHSVTSNFPSENQLHYPRSQNLSIIPNEISSNESEGQTTADSSFNQTSTVTPLVTVRYVHYDVQNDNSSDISPSHVHYKKLSPAESSSNSTLLPDKNNTANIHSPKKNYTSGENSQNNYNNITTPEPYLPDEDFAGYETDEEEILGEADYGILMNPSRRNKRSVVLQSSDVKLSCNAVKMVGSLAELTLTTSDLKEMSASDVADCRMEFGAMELSKPVQEIIWKRIENKVDGIQWLGRLLRLASVADLWDIDFHVFNPWTLETIHAIIRYNNNTMVMKKVMEHLVKYNAEFSVDLLAVLGPAVCSLEPDHLRTLSVIGLDLGPSCPSCLPYLALRATQELGDVTSWTPHFVHSLQAIVAGLDLDNWKLLAASKFKPLAGLQPSAAKCLNTSHLEVLSPDQIRMIPVASLLSLSEHQLAALHSTQFEAVKNITYPSIIEKMTPTMPVYVAGLPTGNSNQMLPTVLLITFISIFNFLNVFKR